MYNDIMMQGFGMGLPHWLASLFIPLLLWGIFWKGLALWHSARRSEQWWFIAFLFINTFGILEIIYLFVFAKRSLHTLFRKD